MNNFVKSFVFPFIISLIIFSFIAFAMVGPTLELIFSEDSSENADEDLQDGNKDDLASSAIKAPGSGNLTLLLVGTDEIVYNATEEVTPPPSDDTNLDGTTVIDPDQALRDEFEALAEKFKVKPTRTVDFLTVVSIDSASGKTLITAIPTETRVCINNVYTSVNSAYYFIENSLYGLDFGYFADYVNAVTGCEVDYYAYIDTDDYVKVADKLGRIPVTLDEGARKSDTQGNIEYMYSEGELKLSSRDLKNIIKHEGFTNVFTKTSVLNQVSQYVLDRTTTTGHYIDFEEKFREITAYYYNSNISFDSFENDIPLYFSYSFFTPARLNPVGDLTSVDGKSVFTINTKSTINLFKQK